MSQPPRSPGSRSPGSRSHGPRSHGPRSHGPWSRVGAVLAGAASAVSRLGPRLWAAVTLGAVLVIALAISVGAMVTPATRAGHPTASVMPLPATTPPTPTPSASSTGTPSGKPSPNTTAPPKPPKMKASGKFDTANAKVPAVSTSGDLRRYTVRVETTAKLKVDRVAQQIAGVLNDPRSWAGSGGVRFSLVADPAKADFSITLGAPATAAKFCQPDAAGTCTDSADVVINAALWSVTPGGYSGDSAGWQAYLVNHGMGQLLGEKSVDCAKANRPAPVMMPQAGDLGGCAANPWPYP